MERELKEITLSNGEIVKMISSLTWGEKEKINNSMISGAKFDGKGISGVDTDAFSNYKYTALEICIKEIIPLSPTLGKPHGFTKDWINELSADDGDLVYGIIESMINKKKV